MCRKVTLVSARADKLLRTGTGKKSRPARAEFDAAGQCRRPVPRANDAGDWAQWFGYSGDCACGALSSTRCIKALAECSARTMGAAAAALMARSG